MKRAIYIRMCLLSLCVMILTAFATLGVSYVNYKDKLTSEIESQALAIVSDYENAEDKLSVLDELSRANPTRITAIDIDGNVIFENRLDASNMENHSNRPEIIEARENWQCVGYKIFNFSF